MSIDFTDILWKKQKEYMEEFLPNVFSRFKSIRNVFNYFEHGQTVAQIACGSVNDDLFLTMNRIGKDGKIILIDEDPNFIYNRALKIVGKENLPKRKHFYIRNKNGRRHVKELFSEANVKAYVQHLPPYPIQIPDESIDNVMAINAAFELMSQRVGGPKADPQGLITETYKKLKKGGSFIVQGILAGDVDGLFASVLYKASKTNKLNFKREIEMKYPPLESYGAGEWGRWVKI